MLKQIQQALNLLLQAICEVSPAAMGFVPGRSIRTNAEAHVGALLADKDHGDIIAYNVTDLCLVNTDETD